MLVRLRVDGILREVERIPKEHAAGVISRRQGAGQARHRRAPHAAGRPHLGSCEEQRPLVRHSHRRAADGRGRRRDHALAREDPSRADADRDRTLERAADEARGGRLPADRSVPRHRPDRKRQVDDDLCGALRRPSARDQRDHDRGPGRVPAAGRLPAAGEQPRRPDVRDGLACDPARGSRSADGRRDSRSRDGEDRARSGDDRARGVLHAAHERCPGCAHAPEGSRRRAFGHRLGDQRRACAAPRAPPLRGVPRALRVEQGRSRVPRLHAGGDRTRRDALPGDEGARNARRATAAGPASTS